MQHFIDDKRLFDDLCHVDALRQGFRAVRRNKGAPGIDGVTVEDFERYLEKELHQLAEELRNWLYRPKPVKRVEIPKPGKVFVYSDSPRCGIASCRRLSNN